MDASKTTSDTSAADDQVVVSLRQLVNMQYRARGLHWSAAKTVHSALVGRHRSLWRGRGLDFEELRHYRVGDDIRTMDWKVSQRTRKPHVRIFTEERERRVILAVDQRCSMFFGSRRAMKSVAAAELAALFGWRTLADGDRVGTMVFNDDCIQELPSRRSSQHFLQQLHLVQDFNRQLLNAGSSNPGQLNRALCQLQTLAAHDTLICVITDLAGADEQTERLLSRLGQHNDLMLVFVYDPIEEALPRGGCLTVSDGELQLEVDTDNPDLRQRYRDYFQQRLAQAQQYLRGCNIPVLPITTAEPVDRQLVQILQPTAR